MARKIGVGYRFIAFICIFCILQPFNVLAKNNNVIAEPEIFNHSIYNVEFCKDSDEYKNATDEEQNYLLVSCFLMNKFIVYQKALKKEAESRNLSSKCTLAATWGLSSLGGLVCVFGFTPVGVLMIISSMAPSALYALIAKVWGAEQDGQKEDAMASTFISGFLGHIYGVSEYFDSNKELEKIKSLTNLDDDLSKIEIWYISNQERFSSEEQFYIEDQIIEVRKNPYLFKNITAHLDAFIKAPKKMRGSLMRYAF